MQLRPISKTLIEPQPLPELYNNQIPKLLVHELMHEEVRFAERNQALALYGAWRAGDGD
jgi:hypothetical protein